MEGYKNLERTGRSGREAWERDGRRVREAFLLLLLLELELAVRLCTILSIIHRRIHKLLTRPLNTTISSDQIRLATRSWTEDDCLQTDYVPLRVI